MRPLHAGLAAFVTLLLWLPLGCGDPETTESAATTSAAIGPQADPPPQDPADTEVWEPEPEVVEPGRGGSPPTDAIILFDGADLSGWSHEDGSSAGWHVEDGAMTVVPGAGSIQTRQEFGDVQLHIEWRAPAYVSGDGQGRGNSGVFLMERYELQVLDSYENKTYSNGQAGSVYKQHVPMVNASRGPGLWQSYDVAFTAPRFSAEGTLVSAAYMTVFHNGVLILNHVELLGPTVFIGQPEYEAHGDRAPILLQDHSNPVSFRNIWVREIRRIDAGDVDR